MSKFSRFLRRITKFSTGQQFKTERQLLAGKSVAAKTNHPSILFFTIHKAASSYVNDTLCKIATASSFLPADFGRYSFQNTSEKLKLTDQYFQANGIYYGALREPIDISPAKKVKTVVQVRDPRDAITSKYFSFIYSHRLPNHEDRRKAFEKRRQELSQQGIDEYARGTGTPILETLMSYSDSFLASEDVLTVHYEDMVTDFSSWLDEIVDYLELPKTHRLQKAIYDIKAEANFEVEKEDIHKHKRQVTPGDHARKLQPETIRQLNQEFAPYFKKLAETDNLPKTYAFPDLTYKATTSDAA